MDDEALREPFMADQEGLGCPFDEALLQELAALDAAEAGGGSSGFDTTQQDGHVEDTDVYRIKELIREKPRDVIQYLEEEGVVKLGEFLVTDAIAFRAFEKEQLLTLGTDHYEVDWETMWRERLTDYARPQEGKSALGWSTKVTVEAHVVNLRDAAAEGSKGLLHPLLKRFHAHACSPTVFALPAVQAVINFKWTGWARTFLLYELFCYCLWLASFTAFTLIFQGEDWTMTFWESVQDRQGFLALLFSLLSLVPMSAFLYMELCTIAAYGWGWLRAWNVLDMASYILQVAICVLHVQRTFVDEGWFSVLVASQQVLLWMKLHYFAKVFNPTKNTIVDTIRIVMEDLKWFLAFFGLTLVGFGLAFYALFRQDRQFPDFANIWHSMASMFSYMLAMFDYNVFYGSTNPTAAMLLFIAFEFVFNVLLLNVLIASMSNSFSKISQDEGLRLLHSKAEIIDELEATLPQWVRNHSVWYPAFVHILKIHPDATYEVNLNSVWSGMGLMENNLLGAQQETRLRVEELEDRLGKLHKKLDVLIKLFISSLGPSQALMLSRQATLGHAAPPAGPQGFASFGMPGRSSLQAGSPIWPGRGAPSVSVGAGASGLYGQHAASHGFTPGGTPGGPGFLRHAMTTLGHLPEQLVGVAGPLVGAPLHLGGHYGGGGADRGLARRSGAPGMWTAGASGNTTGIVTPTDRQTGDGSSGISRAGSGTMGLGATTAAAAARGSYTTGPGVRQGYGGGAAHHAAEQQGPWLDDLRNSSLTGGSSGLMSLGSGHIGPMLSQQQAWQLLHQQQHTGVGGGTAAQRVRMVRPLDGHGGLTRANSL